MERILRRLRRKCEGIWFRFAGEPHSDGATFIGVRDIVTRRGHMAANPLCRTPRKV